MSDSEREVEVRDWTPNERFLMMGRIALETDLRDHAKAVAALEAIRMLITKSGGFLNNNLDNLRRAGL